MISRLTTRIGSLIEHQLATIPETVGEDIAWEASIVPGDREPVLFVVFGTKGAVLGSRVFSQALLPASILDDEAVGRTVRGLVEGLWQARSRQLADAQRPDGA